MKSVTVVPDGDVGEDPQAMANATIATVALDSPWCACLGIGPPDAGELDDRRLAHYQDEPATRSVGLAE